MPVTAVLSKKFYEKFGEDVTNELVNWFNAVDATYRADLRELNELNFARFDAKLEQRLAESDAKLEQRLAQSDAKLEQRMAELRSSVAERLAGLESPAPPTACQLNRISTAPGMSIGPLRGAPRAAAGTPLDCA